MSESVIKINDYGKDVSNLITPFQDRITFTKKVVKQYPDGKIEFYGRGTFAVNLNSNQEGVITIDASISPASMISGTANINNLKGVNTFATYYSASKTLFNVLHNGVSKDQSFSCFATWYI